MNYPRRAREVEEDEREGEELALVVSDDEESDDEAAKQNGAETGRKPLRKRRRRRRTKTATAIRAVNQRQQLAILAVQAVLAAPVLRLPVMHQMTKNQNPGGKGSVTLAGSVLKNLCEKQRRIEKLGVEKTDRTRKIPWPMRRRRR